MAGTVSYLFYYKSISCLSGRRSPWLSISLFGGPSCSRSCCNDADADIDVCCVVILAGTVLAART
ncbi:MAG: hypothetical protein ACLTMP_13565 [Eggerthella lenta]